VVGAESNPRVISPVMWPGFRRRWQQRLNAGLVSRAVNRALGPRRSDERRVAVATVPVAADLVGRVEVDRWVYYCPDDFSVWPGLDGDVMREVEPRLVGRVDGLVAVSETLQSRLAGMGRSAELLTHGIDLSRWSSASGERGAQGERSGVGEVAGLLRAAARPLVLFWGLIDSRLDIEWCRALAGALRNRGAFVLLGPQQSPDRALSALPEVVMPGAVVHEALPGLAAMADVLVMPYADLPVTRAMQPLKFKEYLATGKPVVARDLPATRAWGDTADLVDTASQFVTRVLLRAERGIPVEQSNARRRLAHESWDEKARVFEAILLGEAA
jgi:glycosyltransferase involved in cell wall biosynthesis